MVMSHLNAGFDVSKVGVPVVCTHCRGRGAGSSTQGDLSNQGFWSARFVKSAFIHSPIHSFNGWWLEYLVCPRAVAGARDARATYLWPLWNPASAERERHRNDCKIIPDPCDECG